MKKFKEYVHETITEAETPEDIRARSHNAAVTTDTAKNTTANFESVFGKDALNIPKSLAKQLLNVYVRTGNVGTNPTEKSYFDALGKLGEYGQLAGGEKARIDKGIKLFIAKQG